MFCPERGSTALLLGLLFSTSSSSRALHLVPGKSLVPTMLGHGAVVWDRNMVHGQKGPALHSSSFCQKQIGTSESHSGQGFNGLHPLSPASTPPCSSWWRRVRRKWEKQRGSGGRLVLVTVPAISANHHSLAFMFQREL